MNFTLSEIVISGERRIFFDGDDPESFSGALTFVDNDNQTVKTVRIYTMVSSSHTPPAFVACRGRMGLK